jgi:hypothetical protein
MIDNQGTWLPEIHGFSEKITLIKIQLAQLCAEWRIPLADFLVYLLPHFFQIQIQIQKNFIQK